MGKKRKAGFKPSASGDVPRNAKLAVNSWEDVADSEDEFHMQRDKLLVEPLRKRQRVEEGFEEASDREILPDEDDDELEEDLGDEDDETDDDGALQDDLNAQRPATVTHGELDSRTGLEEDEDVGGWGSSKREYYDADVIKTEADALEEEQEALRLQRKQLQGMIEEDYGFNEIAWRDDGKDEGSEDEGIYRETLPQLDIADDMDVKQRTELLHARYPELEPLAQEYSELQGMYEESALALAAAKSIEDRFQLQKEGKASALPSSARCITATVKHNALSAYLAALSMYFAVLTSSKPQVDGRVLAKNPAELQKHPIMETLVNCRELWFKVKDVKLPEREVVPEAIPVPSHQQTKKTDMSKPAVGENGVQKPKRMRKSKAQKAAEIALKESEARRAERRRQMEEELAKLSSDAPNRRKQLVGTTNQRVAGADEDNSDFGEETTLTAAEAAEKARRKKSLKFYTSQIAQKDNRRVLASKNAGGDDDLPHRERFRDRVERLNAEAEARGKKGRSSNLEPLGGESDDEDRRAATALREEVDGDDYYQEVASRTNRKKMDRSVHKELQREAELQGARLRQLETFDADGKRAIGYEIEKNNGRPPRRKKEVRNPRVKKKLKYEQKKKKLGSIRPVYKGGEGRGGYVGELTGIKTGLVRATKL